MSLTIAVVIPTHDRLEGLWGSISSLLAQTVSPDEIIVVDDGSQEPVPDAVFDSFHAEIKVKLLRNEKPMGGNNARNRGVLASTSDYIAFLDDDDAFKPNKIEELKKAIYASNEADIIYHPAHIHMANEGVSYFSKPKVFKDGEDVFRHLLVKNVIGGTPMVTIKRQSLVDVGLFDEKMPALQDYELWLRLAKNGFRFFFIETALTDYYYETKKSSVSKSIDVNEVAIGLIEKKFSEDYKLLSRSEKKDYECWKRRKLVHKSLLNGCFFKALRYQFYLFMFSPSFANFIPLLVIPLGPKMVFKLKAKVG